MTTTSRLMYLSVCDNRDNTPEPVSSPFSPLLFHGCTQVHRLSPPRSRMYTGSCIWVCMTSVYHLPAPPSVWESSISTLFISSSFTTPTPSTSSPPRFHFIHYNKHNLVPTQSPTDDRRLTTSGRILFYKSWKKILENCKWFVPNFMHHRTNSFK